MPPTHTLVQITDPHLVPEGALLRGRVDAGAGFARTLAVVEESGVRPDALVFTGDLVDAGDEASYRRFRAMVDPVAERLGTEVVVVAGEVTLQGEVTQRRDKRLAEDLIENLPGVKDVHNRLRVGDGSSRKENDPSRPGQSNRSSQSSGKSSAMSSDRSPSSSERSSS